METENKKWKAHCNGCGRFFACWEQDYRAKEWVKCSACINKAHRFMAANCGKAVA